MTYEIAAAGYVCHPRDGYADTGPIGGIGWGETEDQAWAKACALMGPFFDDNADEIPYDIVRKGFEFLPASRRCLDMLDHAKGRCGAYWVMVWGVACTPREAQDRELVLEAEAEARVKANHDRNAADAEAAYEIALARFNASKAAHDALFTEIFGN